MYHAVGGSIPLVTGLPLVVTLLDLAPWELPGAYQRGTASRFGQRLRARLLRDAAAVIVGTEAVGGVGSAAAPHPAGPDPGRALAPRPAFRYAAGATPAGQRDAHEPGSARRARAARPAGTLRHLLRADTTRARTSGRCSGRSRSWPPPAAPTACPTTLRGRRGSCSPVHRRTIARRSPGRRLERASARRSRTRRASTTSASASLVRGARAALLPVVSDSAGHAAIEAIACGTPVVASAVGALPEIVGAAGILVEPRDPARLAQALATAFVDDRVHGSLVEIARERADGPSSGRGRTSPTRRGRSTRTPSERATARRSDELAGDGAASRTGPAAAAGPRRERHLRPGLHHLDERLPDRQRDRLAGRVEEERRLGERRSCATCP